MNRISSALVALAGVTTLSVSTAALADNPLGLLHDPQVLRPFVVPVAAVLAYVYRKEIAAWWRTRQLGRRIY